MKKGDELEVLTIKYRKLLEAAEDLATALMELNPDSSFATTVIQNFEKVRDGEA